jgi:hypothetical protein
MSVCASENVVCATLVNTDKYRTELQFVANRMNALLKRFYSTLPEAAAAARTASTPRAVSSVAQEKIPPPKRYPMPFPVV